MYQRMRLSVFRHFVATTQVVFMQLLAASKVNIEKRKNEADFPQYATMFEFAVRMLLIPRQELEALRTELAQATRGFAQKLVDPTQWAPPVIALTTGRSLLGHLEREMARERKITTAENGKPAIRDKHGKLWTKEELDRAIALRGDVASQIDPLINQLLADEDIRRRFTSNPDNTSEELGKLLDEMAVKNAEFTRKIRDDAGYAHNMAPLARPDKKNPADVPGLRFVLRGIHLLAHEAVGEFFERDRYYAVGVNAALAAIQFGRDMIAIAEFGTTAIAAIFCPPLVGMAVGAAWSAYHEVELREKQRVYGALMDPEAVFSYAEIEAGLFANHIGAALNFIPVGKILRIEKGLAKVAATRAGKYLVKIPLTVLKELEDYLAVAFIKYVAVDRVMGALMERMLAPFIEEIQRKHLTLAQVEALAKEAKP